MSRFIIKKVKGEDGREYTEVHLPEQMKPGWYHNASDSFETDIKFCEEHPGTQYKNWHGPFRTWGLAKADAVAYHASDRDNARYAIKLLLETKKPKKKTGTVGKI